MNPLSWLTKRKPLAMLEYVTGCFSAMDDSLEYAYIRHIRSLACGALLASTSGNQQAKERIYYAMAAYPYTCMLDQHPFVFGSSEIPHHGQGWRQTELSEVMSAERARPAEMAVGNYLHYGYGGEARTIITEMAELLPRFRMLFPGVAIVSAEEVKLRKLQPSGTVAWYGFCGTVSMKDIAVALANSKAVIFCYHGTVSAGVLKCCGQHEAPMADAIDAAVANGIHMAQALEVVAQSRPQAERVDTFPISAIPCTRTRNKVRA